MNKVELISAIAEGTGFTKKDVKSVMESMQNVTFKELAAGHEVKLMDAVTLSTVYKDAHTGRNPMTGESVEVAAKYAVRCKFGQKIKDVVNAK